jgi:hypothetical protein
MNSINVVLTVIMFALFAVSGLLVKFPDKGDDLMVQLAKGQLFSEEGIYIGNIEALEGTIEQRISGGGGWKNLSVGDKIISGMEIRTLAESSADVKFDDGSIMHMDEITQLTFENRLYQINISLINGFIYNKVGFVTSRKYNVEVENYRIETLSSVFAVKKEFQADPELLVFEKNVDVFSGNEKNGNFKKGTKTYLRKELIEQVEVSKGDFVNNEVIWNR